MDQTNQSVFNIVGKPWEPPACKPKGSVSIHERCGGEEMPEDSVRLWLTPDQLFDLITSAEVAAMDPSDKTEAGFYAILAVVRSQTLEAGKQ